MTTDERVTVRLVFTGRCRLKGGKIGHTFRLINDTPALQPDTERVYSKSTAKVVGGVYEVEAKAADGASVYLATLRFTGDLWPDKYDRLRWQTAHEAISEAERTRLAEQRAAKRTDLDDVFAPLEQAARELRTLQDVDALVRLATRRIYDAHLHRK